jgi:hypothetical protein
MIEPNPWPFPLFSPDDILDMRAFLMRNYDFSAKDVQDLPPLDLWQLYRQAEIEAGVPSDSPLAKGDKRCRR